MMMTSRLPEVGPTARYVATTVPAPEPPAVKPVMIDDSRTITARVIGLFDGGRRDVLEQAIQQVREVKLVRFDGDHAELTFAYDPNCELLKNAKPEQLIERISNRLRSLTRHTMSLKTVGDLPREKLERIEIPIVGLDCQACTLAAYESLAQVEGVEQATASFREGRAVAWIDPAKTNREALEMALERRGVTLGGREAK
jgi:copper chaperone CopZ